MSKPSPSVQNHLFTPAAHNSSHPKKSLPLASEGLRGNIWESELQSGLAIKESRLHISGQLHIPTPFFTALRLIVVLEGQTELLFDGHLVTVPAGYGALLNPYHDTEGVKYYRCKHQHELVLFFEPEWLAQHTDIAVLFPQNIWRPHLFAVTPAMRLICSTLQRNDAHPALQLLQQESQSIVLLQEVLQTLFFSSRPAVPTNSLKRLRQLTDLLHSGEADHWTLKQMAAACHSNTTTLQREFQQQYGQTIAAYLHQLKLQKAAAMLKAGASLHEAAEAAGYRHAENFSKAFFRAYGRYPKKRLPVNYQQALGPVDN